MEKTVIKNKWPWKNSEATINELRQGKCKIHAEKIQKIIGGDIFKVKGKNSKYIGEMFNKNKELIKSDFEDHFFVRKGNKIYDRVTGPEGMDFNDYKKNFKYFDYLNYEKIDK